MLIGMMMGRVPILRPTALVAPTNISTHGICDRFGTEPRNPLQ